MFHYQLPVRSLQWIRQYPVGRKATGSIWTHRHQDLQIIRQGHPQNYYRVDIKAIVGANLMIMRPRR